MEYFWTEKHWAAHYSCGIPLPQGWSSELSLLSTWNLRFLSLCSGKSPNFKQCFTSIIIASVQTQWSNNTTFPPNDLDFLTNIKTLEWGSLLKHPLIYLKNKSKIYHKEDSISNYPTLFTIIKSRCLASCFLTFLNKSIFSLACTTFRFTHPELLITPFTFHSNTSSQVVTEINFCTNTSNFTLTQVQGSCSITLH